jgi:hypothetical protein
MSAPTANSATLISRENIRVAAETVGVELTEDVIKTLCQEVEYRVREITQVRCASAPYFLVHHAYIHQWIGF